MRIEIRPASPSDAVALKEIAKLTIGRCYRFLGDSAVESFISGPADAYVDEHLEQCNVLTGDQRPLGFSICQTNRIDLIMIDFNFHRRGLGTQLLAWVENELFRRYSRLELESFVDNEQANRFYRKHNWLERERYLDSNGSGFQKIIFEKHRPTA